MDILIRVFMSFACIYVYGMLFERLTKLKLALKIELKKKFDNFFLVKTNTQLFFCIDAILVSILCVSKMKWTNYYVTDLVRFDR